MSMFASAEMTKIRARSEALLPGTCMIQTGTIVLDTIGGSTVTFGATATGVPCKLTAKTRTQGGSGDQFSVYTEWIFHLPYDEVVAVGQRIIYGSDNYEVVSVEDDHDWRVFRNVVAKRAE